MRLIGSLLILLLLPLSGQAAPTKLRTTDRLATWLADAARRRPKTLEVTVGELSLKARVEKGPGRNALLEEAELTFGALSLSGRVETGREGDHRTFKVTIQKGSLGAHDLGTGTAELRYLRREGWSGSATLQSPGWAALSVALAPKPKRCRGAECAEVPPRLRVEAQALKLGPILTTALEDGHWATALDGEVTLQLNADGPLEQPVISGQLSGPLSLSGEPLGTAKIALSQAAEADTIVAQAHLEGVLAKAFKITAHVPYRLDADQWVWPRADGETHLKVALQVQGLDLAAATRAVPRLGASGQLDLSVEMIGAEAEVLLNARDVSWRGEKVGGISAMGGLRESLSYGLLSWNAGAGAGAELSWSVPAQWDPEALDFEWLHTQPLQVAAKATGLTPAVLRPFWKAHPAAQFTADLTFKASGPLRDLKSEGTLTGTLADQGRTALPLTGKLELGPKFQRLSVRIGEAMSWVAQTKLPLKAWREGKSHAASAPVESILKLNVPLETLTPYLPGNLYDPRGELEGEFNVSGTLGAPVFGGEAALADGAATAVALHQRLRRLNVAAKAEGNTLKFTSLTAVTGVGSVQGQGEMTLVATPKAAAKGDTLWSDWHLKTHLEFEAKDAPFLHDLAPGGLLSCGVVIDAAQHPGTAEVTVTVNNAQLNLLPIRLPSASAIPHNGRVRLVDWTGSRSSAQRLFEGDGKLLLRVALADPMQIKGQGIEMVLTGAMNLDRDPIRAVVDGGFDVQSGSFTLFENAFSLRRGRLTLQGGPFEEAIEDADESAAQLRDPDAPPKAYALEPVYDLLAEGEAVGTYVDLAIRGPARRPELVLASDPPLPDYRILTLLITGRVDAVDGRNGDVRRQVAQLVDRFHNPSLSRQLYDRIGVDKLGVQFASLSQPVLTVGKQVNRRLYLETVYHHNSPPDANNKEARVEYRLDPAWTLDSAYGDAAVGSFGLFWRTDFGGPPVKHAATRPLSGPTP